MDRGQGTRGLGAGDHAPALSGIRADLRTRQGGVSPQHLVANYLPKKRCGFVAPVVISTKKSLDFEIARSITAFLVD